MFFVPAMAPVRVALSAEAPLDLIFILADDK